MQRLARFGRRAALLVIGLAVASFVRVPAAAGFDVRGGEELRIEREQTINDDLYAAAETITIDGTVRGDAVVAGRTIVLNGNVEGSLMAAAQTVIINGTVHGSARTAAQAIAIGPGATIGRDLIAFCYSLETRPGSTVSRDLGVWAYQALLTGAVARNVRGGTNGLELRGSVGGNVDVEVGDREPDGRAGGGAAIGSPVPAVAIPSVPTGLTVTQSATIGGMLSYTSREQYPIAGQVAGGVTWRQRPVEERPAADPRRPLANVLRQFLTLALIGLLLLWIAPAWVTRLADIVEVQPLPAFGWGLVAGFLFFWTVVALALAAIVLAIVFGIATLGGLAALTLGLGFVGEIVLVAAFVILTAFIAQVLVSYLGGRWLLQRLRPDGTASRATPLITGLVVFVVLSALPVLGPFLKLVVAVLGLGAVWLWGRERLRPAAAGPAAPAASPGS